MNILKRNKEIIKRHDAGETFLAMSKEYGIDAGSMSKVYYDFEFLIDRQYYDIVAGMGFSSQVGTKLVNLLHKYETMHNVTLTLETISDIPRWEFHSLRGAGVSVLSAFDRLQEALRNE